MNLSDRIASQSEEGSGRGKGSSLVEPAKSSQCSVEAFNPSTLEPRPVDVQV